MVKYIFRLTALSLSLLLHSCGVPKVIQENFDCYYDKTSLNYDSLINTDGFYVIKDSTNYPPFYKTILFQEDGIVFSNLNNSVTYNGDNYIDYLKYYTNQLVGDNTPTGIYSISNDTIKVQVINNPTIPKVWGAYEVYYKIIDRNTLVEIDARLLHKHTSDDSVRFNSTRKYIKKSEAKFVKMENMPVFDSWLKREKWFWCNEKEWKEYMESLKLKKKGKED